MSLTDPEHAVIVLGSNGSVGCGVVQFLLDAPGFRPVAASRPGRSLKIETLLAIPPKSRKPARLGHLAPRAPKTALSALRGREIDLPPPSGPLFRRTANGMTLWHPTGYARYTTSCAGQGIDQRIYRLDYDAHAIATWITNLGNLAVVAPAAMLVWVWMVWRRGFAAAIRYQWPIAVTFVVTVTLKFVSRAHGGVFTGTPYALSIGAPSGHMAMSTVVYGGVAMMLLRRGAEPVVLLSTILTVAVLAGVAVTRVTLHTHTPVDVLAGFLVGGACAVWMGSVAEVPAREPVRYIGELVLMMVGIVLLMHFSGLRFNSTNVM